MTLIKTSQIKQIQNEKFIIVFREQVIDLLQIMICCKSFQHKNHGVTVYPMLPHDVSSHACHFTMKSDVYSQSIQLKAELIDLLIFD